MATSTKQTVATVPVYDYVLAAGDPTNVNPSGLKGKKVKVTLAYDRQRSSAPSTWLIETPTYAAVTDTNGFWQVNVVPTDQMAIANTYYIVEIEGYASYKINPTNAGVPGIGWQSSAILLDTPATLGSAGQTITGPVQVNGTLGVTGAVTLSALTQGQVVFPGVGGLLSGDTNLFWDNTNKRLGIGTNVPVDVIGVAGSGAYTGIGINDLSNANSVQLRLYENGVLKGLLGAIGANAVLLNDALAGDVIIRTQGGSFRVTTNSGTSTALQVLTTGGSGQLNVTGVMGFISLGGNASIVPLTVNPTQITNNAQTAANILITDAGIVTIRAGLTVNAGGVTVTGSSVIQNNGGNAYWDAFGAAGTHTWRTNNAATTLAVLSSSGTLTLVGSLLVQGDVGAGTAASLTLTNAVGIGNGANTNMQAPLKGTGGGPTTATLVTDWIKIYDGATTKWLPAFT